MYDHHLNDSDDEEFCDSAIDGDTVSAMAEDFSLTNSDEENNQDESTTSYSFKLGDTWNTYPTAMFNVAIVYRQHLAIHGPVKKIRLCT